MNRGGAVRRDAEYFGDREAELIYIAKRLAEARALEGLLTSGGIDYAVEPDEYLGGLIFRRVRIGAFFYVLPEAAAQARRFMEGRGYRPYRPPPDGATARRD
ncbi:MAG: hypothetical protein IT159_14160 [Bryobacterales bacterium]|nr:hypothetical protein [Bryobacterales bacterium]